MLGRTNAGGGGGGSGATLTITGVAGATVTASKDDKTYTRTINSSGTAVFKGLSTGTWTVTMSGNGQTTTRTVEITADYSLTIAFFSATISITYPAASTCVVTDSTGATVASDTNADSAAKTWTATVGATGTYTITATDGSGKTKSTTVSITTDGQAASATLTYELILFDGTDNTAVTGGWTFGNNPGSAVTFSDATISNNQIVYSESYYGGIFTKKQIDVTDYKTLYCECTITGYLEYANSFGVSKSTNQAIMDSGMDMNSKFVAKKALAAGTYTGSNALSVDISKITGNCSLGFGVFCSNTLTIKINKVWLV